MKETVGLAVKKQICRLCFPIGAFDYSDIRANLLLRPRPFHDTIQSNQKRKIITEKFSLYSEMSYFDLQDVISIWSSKLSYNFTWQELKHPTHLYLTCFIKAVTLNIQIHFSGGEFLKTVTQFHTKCIAWFYRVKRDERAQWSDIGKPDRDTVLWAGTKIEVVLTRVE